MALLDIPELAAAEGVGTAAPALTDAVLLHRTDGQPKASTVADVVALLRSLRGVVPVYDIKAFGAIGNGAADDTAAFQAAATAGGVIRISPGRYLVDQVNVPFRDVAFVGESRDTCIIEGRTPNRDIFRVSFGGSVGGRRPVLANHVAFANLTMVINVGSGANLHTAFTRCGAQGQAIGAAAVALQRTNFRNDAAASDEGQLNSWNALFGLIDNCLFKIKGSSTSHFSAAFYANGTTYGWRWCNMLVDGPDYGIMVSPAFLQRCTIAGTRVTTVGANKFANGAKVLVRGHEVSGAQPTGLSRGTLAVSAADTTGFTVSGSGSGGSNPYAMIIGPGGQEFAPDETFIQNFVMRFGRFAVSIPDPQRLTVNGLRTISTRGCLEMPAIESANRTTADTCQVHGLFADFRRISPVATQFAIELFGKVMTVAGLVVTGSEIDGAGRAKVSFGGQDCTIRGLLALSNSGAEAGRQPRLEFNAVNTWIHGGAHQSCVVSVPAAGEVRGRLRSMNDSGASVGSHINTMSNWS